MAENTIDTLSLEIKSDASRAEQSLNKLTNALIKLAGGATRGLGGLRTAAGDIRALNDASKNLNSEKLNTYAKGMQDLSTSIGRFANLGDKITPAVNALQQLSGINLSGLQASGDFRGLSSLAEGAGKLADISPKLAALKASDLNRSLAALQKLGATDFTGVAASLQSLAGLDTSGFVSLSQALGTFSSSAEKLAELGKKDLNAALRNIGRLGTANFNGIAAGMSSLTGVDFSQLSSFGTAFQNLAGSLSGADKVSAGTAKLLTSITTLMQFAANIPAVTSALPGLSEQIINFVNTMSAAPAVQTGTAAIVASLGQLASAGVRAEKVASALPGLTSGISSFVQSLSTMPRINDNILRAVEALGRLASAGGRAGTASRSLQRDITGLSNSMRNLRLGASGMAGSLKSFTSQLLASLGIASGIYGVVRAVKASITTFSDLVEVQNVVEKSFGDMSYKMEKLAKVSIKDFGMSELTAKNIASRYQAMGVAMGFAQDEMSDMSIELTKLAADMASFYNVKQEDVAKSLESVFTGTTKPLRAYGLDLTQATLQEWALKHGIDANVKSMSQAEKTLLRYKFVTEQTKNISGDFLATQGSWANQTRILIEQFRELGSVLGSGLVAALLPAVKALNIFLSKIIQVAKAIASFLGGLLGIKHATAGGGAGLAGVADITDGLAGSTEEAADGISDIGGSAKKAKKDLNGFIAGWQEVTNMTTNDDAGGGSGDMSMPDMTLPSEYDLTVTAEDEASPVLEGIKKRFLELKGLFIKGFKFGLGDVSVFDCIQNHIKNIKSSFLEIVTDGEVTGAFNGMIDTLAFNLGAKVGAFTSIGASIADNILGGLDIYLGEAKERIKTWLVNAFNLVGEIDTIKTNFAVAVTDIFTVFRSDTAKQITADIISLFADGFMNITLLAGKFGRDIIGLILNPITENAEGIKQALENTLAPLETVYSTIADSFVRLWEKVQTTYDEHVAPMFESFTSGMSEIVESLLSGYNTHIAPVLDNLSGKFSDVWVSTLEPIFGNIIGMVGDVADLITAVWEGVLQPVINWVATAIFPVVAPVLDALGSVFGETFKAIGQIFNGFLTSARGVIQFLTGIFNRDWRQLWQGTKMIFKGIWEMMPDVIKAPIRSIIGGVNQMIKAIQGGLNLMIKMINKLSFDVPDWVPEIGGKTFGFNFNEITLPLIPQLAKGGIVNRATLAMIGERGKEAVLPLENNTGWIDNLSERISENVAEKFGHLELDLTVPKMPEYKPQLPDLGTLRNTIEMEMDAKMAQMEFENRQLRASVEQNTRILEQILSKGIVLDDNEFTSRYKSAASKFMDRHHYEMGLYPAGR